MNYAYYHGTSTIALENPEVVGYLRYYWVRNSERKYGDYNYRVSMFKCSIIERIEWKTPLYGLKVAYVDPRGTSSSQEHAETMRKLRLDKYTTSAYLTALRALETLEKPTKT